MSLHVSPGGGSAKEGEGFSGLEQRPLKIWIPSQQLWAKNWSSDAQNSWSNFESRAAGPKKRQHNHQTLEKPKFCQKRMQLQLPFPHMHPRMQNAKHVPRSQIGVLKTKTRPSSSMEFPTIPFISSLCNRPGDRRVQYWANSQSMARRLSAGWQAFGGA